MKSSPNISLEKAGFVDIEFLWYLRNQADVYKYAKQNRGVGWEEHISWIMPVILGTSKKKLFVVKREDLSVGQIRFDYFSQADAEISISLLKEFRGQGFAEKAFKEALKELKKDKKLKILIAVVNKENMSSIRFFEKLQFKLKNKKGDWLKYYLDL